MHYVIYALFGIGLFINAMCVVGLLRFPDLYTRLHAATKTTTFGSIFIVAGVILKTFLYDQTPNITIMVHSAIALVVIIFTNPISAHAIARAALIHGIKPYGVKINELRDRDKKAREEGK